MEFYFSRFFQCPPNGKLINSIMLYTSKKNLKGKWWHAWAWDLVFMFMVMNATLSDIFNDIIFVVVVMCASVPILASVFEFKYILRTITFLTVLCGPPTFISAVACVI